MTWQWPRAVATGSSICVIALLVGLGLPMTLPPPPNVPVPVPTIPPIGGALPGGTGPLGGVGGRTSGPRTFYVSPDGRNWNRGTSQTAPWRTIARVNEAHLEAGDRVLFEGGGTFSDATLMPGQGFDASGTAGQAIVFGSYGRGMARLTRGIWLGTSRAFPAGPSYLTFENLALGPLQGFQGTGDYITLRGLDISHLMAPESKQETGILSEGSHWVIEGNTIYDTGDSGMLLGFSAGAPGVPAGGVDYLVYGNTVSHTGLDSQLSYGRHAIYLKVADARVVDNRLTYFHDDGVSMRYRGATIRHNYIAHGSIGLAWYQYDPTPGMTELIDNTIAYMDDAGIFVCGVAESCTQPIESFVIEHNLMRRTARRRLNLQPTSGTYVVQANSGL